MNHISKRILITLTAGLITLTTMAQSFGELPVKKINGRKYHYYEVKAGETVYSLCRRFGINQEELVKSNPSVEDGLRAGQQLLFPVQPASGKGGETSASHQQVAAEKHLVEHVVEKGETAYGICKKYGLTTEEFFALNPSARDGLRAGTRVKIGRGTETSRTDAARKAEPETSKAVKSGETKPSVQKGQQEYTIQQGETLYQIATRNGMTLRELLDANPTVDPTNYKAGTRLVVAKASASEAREATKTTPPSPLAPAEENEGEVERRVVQSPTPEYGVNPVYSPEDTIVIAITLPFNAGSEQRDSRALRATEFYRGFAVAMDTLRNYGRPVKLLTYDTKGTAEGVSEILADPALRQARVIVAPDMGSQLDQMAPYASRNGIYLLNLFVIKDDSHLTNPFIIQGNIPHTSMYTKAIDYFLTTFPDVTPVVLKRNGGKEDKAEYVEKLKSELSKRGRKFHEIEFSDKLSTTTLEKLPTGANYAFIPVSSTMDEMHKFIDAVKKYKESGASEGSVMLWGYSEWLTARGDNQVRLHDTNTYIFSRFYSVEKDDEEEQLQRSFERWFGTRIADKIPKQGTYGFDTGMFLIRALNVNHGNFDIMSPAYDGIQNAFEFIRVGEGGGLVNDEMFMINFAPDGTIHKFGV